MNRSKSPPKSSTAVAGIGYTLIIHSQQDRTSKIVFFFTLITQCTRKIILYAKRYTIPHNCWILSHPFVLHTCRCKQITTNCTDHVRSEHFLHFPQAHTCLRWILVLPLLQTPHQKCEAWLSTTRASPNIVDCCEFCLAVSMVSRYAAWWTCVLCCCLVKCSCCNSCWIGVCEKESLLDNLCKGHCWNWILPAAQNKCQGVHVHMRKASRITVETYLVNGDVGENIYCSLVTFIIPKSVFWYNG